jgi:hypothetical protein
MERYMKRFINLLAVIGFVFIMAGCGAGSPVVNIDNSNYFEKSEELAKVETAIRKGAAKKGWRVKKVNSGLLEVSNMIRGKFLVMVEIPYTSKGYKINYKRSTNLKYDAAANTIHKSYNKWVSALANNIDFELSNIGMVSSSSSVSTSSAAAATEAPVKTNYKKGKEISLSGKTVYLKSMVPYASNSRVAQAIKTECTINKQIVDFATQKAAELGLNLVVKNKISPNDIELKLQIDDAVSQGGAMRGHSKFVVISGKLVKGNTEYQSFKAGRVSGGGFWGAYKSSCAVLGRTTKALGSDVAMWLSDPYDDAVLGDAYLIR